MTNTKLRKKLLSFLREIDNKDQLLGAIDYLLSPKEMDELAKRLEIVRMLNEGVPQREIAKEVGVGIATVTRGSRVLKEKKSPLKKLLDQEKKK